MAKLRLTLRGKVSVHELHGVDYQFGTGELSLLAAKDGTSPVVQVELDGRAVTDLLRALEGEYEVGVRTGRGGGRDGFTKGKNE